MTFPRHNARKRHHWKVASSKHRQLRREVDQFIVYTEIANGKKIMGIGGADTYTDEGDNTRIQGYQRYNDTKVITMTERVLKSEIQWHMGYGTK